MHDLSETPLATLKVMATMATTLARHLDREHDADADKMWAEAHELQQAVKDREAAMNRFAPLDAIQGRMELLERHGRTLAGAR